MPTQDKLGKIKYGELVRIGEGMTSEVFSSIDQFQRPICVKIIKDSFYKSTLGNRLINNEVQILSELCHPHILQYYEKQFHQGKLALISELCDGGDLRQVITKNTRILSQKSSCKIMGQIVDGCKYLHGLGYIHRDLKPQNIFFHRDVVKIADFGFATNITNKDLLKQNVGSPLYMAPELLSGLSHTFKSDIFALGVIWYELASGKLPWSAGSEAELLKKVEKVEPNMQIVRCGKQISDLIRKCLHKNKEKRPSLQEIKQIIECSLSTGKLVSKTAISVHVGSLGIPHPQKQQPIESKARKENKLLQLKIERNKSMSTGPLAEITNRGRQLSTCQKKTRTAKEGPDFTQILKKLSNHSFAFLPQSLTLQFKLILQKYQGLLQDTIEPQYLLQTQQRGKDSFMSDIFSCTRESDLCRIITGFIRRLIRLTKSYNGNQMQDLNYLWERIEMSFA